MPSLNGKDAIQFLKQEGVYDSLNDALTKASFGANAIPTTQQAQLVAPDGAASDTFGCSIAISGETVVVGSRFGDGGGVFNQGTVHVFVRTGTVWSLQQKLLPVDGSPGQLFGGSVAIDGDTVVIGSPQATISGNMFQGAVYVFARTGSVWSQQQKLTAFDGAAQDQFGQVVSISRDTLVVSARLADVGGNTDQGAAYVFVRTGVTWSLQQKITAADGQVSDNFGASVAIHHETLAIGAPGDDIGPALNRGSVTILVRTGTTWNVQQVVTTPDGISGINFGIAVAIQSDTLAVGANGFFDSNTGSVTGTVFLFTRSSTNWSLQQRVGPSVATSSGQ
ncbi:MAG TPA: FG-GAP repeat protein, partial [Acidobacteriota bacterium]|nr:FG-GAP repeat protein [Acidobacteriota bacterium]